MGTGIAQVAATTGHKVVLFDTNPEALKKAQAFILKMLNRSAEKGRITDLEAKAIFGRLYLAEDLDCLLYTSPSPRDATLSRMPSSA